MAELSGLMPAERIEKAANGKWYVFTQKGIWIWHNTFYMRTAGSWNSLTARKIMKGI